MRVKICGITNYEDAKLAINYGADALGFIFYEKSKRYISVENTKKIISKLPPFIEKVGLFVESDIFSINTIIKETKITLAQIHFDLEDKLYQEIDINYIKVIRAKSSKDILKYRDEYKICDAMSSEYGGSGKRLALEWFKDIDCSNIILAGGLNENNLNELKEFNFYGVDVSSGTESSYGKKDKQKLRNFIEKAKSL